MGGFRLNTFSVFYLLYMEIGMLESVTEFEMQQ